MAFVFAACGAESLVGSVDIAIPRASVANLFPMNSTTEVAPPKASSSSPNQGVGSDPLRSAVEIIPDRLYYIALKSAPTSRKIIRKGKQLSFFQIDTEFLYWNFFLDFGPLNLGQLFRFTKKLNKLLAEKKDHTIVYYSSTDPQKRANATYLIGAWQLLSLDRTPDEALRGFRGMAGEERTGTERSTSKNASSPPLTTSSVSTTALPPFHDASPCVCTYDLTVLDCLRGLAKARMYGFFDFDTFNVEEYEHFEQVENGDLNWIVKDRILAFAGPHFERNVSNEGYCTLTPHDYIPYFTKKRVGLVVRLNKRCYDENDFRQVGIRHLEQYYLDGSCPPVRILNKVLAAFESVEPDQAFAVHCKAGLGRTGTCIGAYLMKHYKFTAAEAIGWMRICRPGMVIGPQQHFLQDIEQRMWHEGSVMRLKPSALNPQSILRTTTPTSKRPSSSSKGSPKSVIAGSAPALHFAEEGAQGIVGQADGLLARRHQHRR